MVAGDLDIERGGEKRDGGKKILAAAVVEGESKAAQLWCQKGIK